MDPAVVSLVWGAAGWHGDLVLLTDVWRGDLSKLVSFTGVLDGGGLKLGKVLVCLGG